MLIVATTAIVADAQYVVDPEAGGPRKPVIDNISAGSTVIGKVDVQMTLVNGDDDTQTGNGGSTGAQATNEAASGTSDSDDHTKMLDDQFERINTALKVYPVPASTHLTIDLGEDAAAQFTLMNVIGRVVHQSEHTGRQVTMELGSLPIGTYFLSVRCGNQVITRKVEVGG